MDLVKDINLDNEYQPKIKDGDFDIVFSDQIHCDLLLQTTKGTFKENPVVGLGLINYMAAPIPSQVIKTLISKEISNDGYRVDKVTDLGNFTYELNAERIR